MSEDNFSWQPNQTILGTTIGGDGSPVVSLDFHRQGNFLVAGTSNSAVYLVDCLSGQETKKIFTKSHGLKQIKYTHHESCILCSSLKKSDEIRYLSLYDNRYLRYFEGHEKRVNSISMSPFDDHFLSASQDNTIRLWDLTSCSAIAKLELPLGLTDPYAAYDESGVVFGVLCRNMEESSHNLKLYDSRAYEHGPFCDLVPDVQLIEDAIGGALITYTRAKVDSLLAANWKSFEFSADGKSVLVNTDSEMLLVFSYILNI